VFHGSEVARAVGGVRADWSTLRQPSAAKAGWTWARGPRRP